VRTLTLIVLSLCLAACGNPRRDPQPQIGNTPAVDRPNGETPQPERKVRLQAAYEVGARFRTTRKLRVEELTVDERYLTEATEITLTEVQRVDDAGRLLAVRRAWEQNRTRFTRGYGAGEEATGELHGCTLQLVQRANGVYATVLTGDASVAGNNFVLEGFDAGLLPISAVGEGDAWRVEGAQLAGLNRFIEAIDFKIEKNRLQCALATLTPDSATITLQWSVSGEMSRNAAVLEFTGKMTYNRKTRMIEAFELSGGRQSQGGPRQQISIEVTRRPVTSWLDLDD
jgi:hypothetical protein